MRTVLETAHGVPRGKAEPRRCLALNPITRIQPVRPATTLPDQPRRLTVVLSLLLLLWLVPGAPILLAQGVENLRDCPIHPGENPVTCPKCARARTSQREDAECQEAKAFLLDKDRSHVSYSSEEVERMGCTTAKVLAEAFGWESPQARKRKSERDAFRAAQAAKREAANAVRAADQQGVVQIREAMSQLENDFRGAVRRSSSPEERATQAGALNRNADELATKAREARAQGLASSAIAAEGAATRMRFMAQELTRDAVRTGLEDALSGVAEEYGVVARDGVEEVLGVPAIPGRYAGERVRDYLESATDRAGTLVPLADSAGNYIAGPLRQGVNELLDSSHRLPTVPSSGGGYSAPTIPSSGGSWGADTSDEAEPEDHERQVDDAVRDLAARARQQQAAEQQKLNELLQILRPPAPAPTSPSPNRRTRFDQPSPSPTPPPRRNRFDATPAPPTGSVDLRGRRYRFD